MDWRLVMVFDGTCGICTRYAEWVLAQDRGGLICAVPNQAPGVLERYGLTRAQVDRELWAIHPTGHQAAGAAAVARILALLGGPWWALAALYEVPPLAWLADRAYRVVATNRSRLARWGVTPACELSTWPR
jgi:predicted DCC family thiol-disulfide oxidoreductase YuxK